MGMPAVGHINTILQDVLKGQNPFDTYGVDSLMIHADGTPDKSRLGANAILAAVSLAALLPCSGASLGTPYTASRRRQWQLSAPYR